MLFVCAFTHTVQYVCVSLTAYFSFCSPGVCCEMTQSFVVHVGVCVDAGELLVRVSVREQCRLTGSVTSTLSKVQMTVSVCVLP